MMLEALNSTVIEEIGREVERQINPIYTEVMKIKSMMANDPWLNMTLPEFLKPYFGILMFIVMVMALVASIFAIAYTARSPRIAKIETDSTIIRKELEALAYWTTRENQQLLERIKKLEEKLGVKPDEAGSGQS